MSQSEDPFYIGYQSSAPAPLGRFLRRVVGALWLLAIAVSLIVVLGQQPFAAAVFEFGQLRSFEGTLLSVPQPMLLVARPGEQAGTETWSTYVLVNPGKLGVTEIEGLSGRRVRLEGTLIYRDDQTMIEIVPDSIKAIGDGAALSGSIVELGEHRLVGEIVDSKCFMGVMNPGNLKPHRACAARCISGGIPPILLVRQPDGTARHLLLVGPQGEAINKQVLDFIAEPVEITGALEKHWDKFVLKADPARIRRLDAEALRGAAELPGGADRAEGGLRPAGAK